MNPTVKKILKWTILCVLLAYVVGMELWARSEAERNTCKGVTITMDEKGLSDTITVRGVKDKLLRYPRKIVGAPVNLVNTLDIENYLMRLNNFEDVKCYLSSNGYLNVAITPMIPEIRVFDGNKSYYVNKDGKRIDSNADFFADVPVVSGHFNSRFRPEDVLPVVRFVRNDPQLSELVSMFSAKDKDNIILVPRITGHVINFGDTTRLPEKRRALLTAYKKIIPFKGWEEYDTISVRFRGQIVATRRDKAPLYPIETFFEETDPEEAALPGDVESTPADSTAVNKKPKQASQT